VFDLTDRDSFFSAVGSWFNDLKEYGKKDQTLLLVGNKKDLCQERKVYLREIDDMITKLKLNYIEVSAKTGDNVQYLFEYMALKFLAKDEQLKKLPDSSNYYTTIMRNSLSLDKSLHCEEYNKRRERMKRQSCCN
jgi:Ras-related protein Rab-2A